jgi:WD40 repeat protein
MRNVKTALSVGLILCASFAVLWTQRAVCFPQLYPQILGSLPYALTSVAVSPNGQLTAVCGGDYFPGRGEVRVWNAHKGNRVQTLPLTLANPWSLAFSPDSRFLAVGTAFPEGTVRLWDMQTDQQRVLIAGNPASSMDDLAFSPDGHVLAVNGIGTLALYSVTDGKLLWKRTDRSSDGDVLAFSPDGKTLVCAAHADLVKDPTAVYPIPKFVHGEAQILDAQTGRLVADFPNPTNVLTQAAAFSPDGRSFAVGSDKMSGGGILGSVLTLYTLSDNHAQWTRHISNGMTALCFAPDGHTLVAEEGREALASWNVQNGTSLAQISGHQTSWSDTSDVLAFAPNGQTLAHRQGKEVQVWKAQSLR